MRNKKFYKNTKANSIKIFRVLKSSEEDFLTVGEIARRSGLHKWIVSRTLDLWMSPFIDITIPEELEAVGVRMKLVRLKGEFSEKQILRGLELRREL
jgi:hypothetical protein